MKLRTAEGVFTVRALEDTTSLGAVPLAIARPAIVRELTSERRADAYVAWTIRQQKSAESRLVCERDRLPGARSGVALELRAVPLPARGRDK